MNLSSWHYLRLQQHCSCSSEQRKTGTDDQRSCECFENEIRQRVVTTAGGPKRVKFAAMKSMHPRKITHANLPAQMKSMARADDATSSERM